MQRKHYTEEEKNAVISQYPYDNAVMESATGLNGR